MGFIAEANVQKNTQPPPPIVFHDHSVRFISPFRHGHDEPVVFSGTLGSGLREGYHADRDSILNFPIPTPAAEPRHSPERQNKESSSDFAYPPALEPVQLPWELAIPGVLITAGTLSLWGSNRLRKIDNKWAKRGSILLGGTGAVEIGLATAACMPRAAETTPAPFTLSNESAMARIQDLGSSFMIGNSNASFTDVTCGSDSSAVAFCTAKLSIDNAIVGNAAVLVQSTGEVLVANLASGRFAIDVDAKNATGQLAVLTKDKKLVQKSDASFGATMSNGVIDSISWVRVGDQILDIGPANVGKGSDAFVSVISQPEFIAVGSLISAALTSPEFTLTTDSTPTPRSTETPTAVPTPTETPDPFAGAPEGATEFNTERGLWQNAEGKFYITELQTWAETLNKNNIYLIDTSVAPSWFMDGVSPSFQSFPVDYYRLPGAEAIFNSFEQSPGYTEQYSQDQDLYLSGLPHQSKFAWHLGARMKNHPVTYEDPSEVNTALKAMQKGELLLPLDIPVVAYDNSNTTTKFFDATKGVVIVQIPFASTDQDMSYFGQPSNAYRWKLDVVDNRLVAYIAMQGSFPTQDKVFVTQFPLTAAILGRQLPTFEPRGFNVVDSNNFLHTAQAQGVTADEYDKVLGDFLILLSSGEGPSDIEEASGQTIPFFQVK